MMSTREKKGRGRGFVFWNITEYYNLVQFSIDPRNVQVRSTIIKKDV